MGKGRSLSDKPEGRDVYLRTTFGGVQGHVPWFLTSFVALWEEKRPGSIPVFKGLICLGVLVIPVKLSLYFFHIHITWVEG